MNNGDPFNIDVAAVCERFANARPGMRLVDGVVVGLPIYEVTLSLLVQDERPIPPVHEYAMRSVAGGLNDPTEVEGFLGLSRPTVRRILSDLMRQDELHLAATGSQGHQYLAVTQKGSRTLEQASLFVPQEVVVTVRFDGLARVPLEPSNDSLHWPRELRDRGIIDIPPTPARPPSAREISVAGLDAYVRRLRRGRSSSRMVLAVKDVTRTFRQYRLGVALVYARDEAAELQVLFSYDGRLRDEYAEAFSRSRAFRKLGFMKKLEDSIRARVEQQPELARDFPAEDTDAEDEARDRLAQARQESVHQAAIPKDSLAAETDSAQANVDAAKSILDSQTIRSVRTYEHPPLLDRAFIEAKERLLIISPWINAEVVDRQKMRRLTLLVLRGCHVSIGWGLGPEADDRCLNNPWNRRVIDALQQLAEQHDNFDFARLGDTHAKVLVVDRVFCVRTSFNWLSFRGDPDRTFRDEQGFYVTRPKLVDEVYDENHARIKKATCG